MILTIGPGGSGLTFLNWSIVYLRGDNFYTLLNKKTTRVIDNPILNTTAHGYQKDHFLFSTKNLIKLHSATEQSVIYIVPTHQDDLEYILQFEGKKIIFNSDKSSTELMARMWYNIPDCSINKLIEDLSVKYDKQIIKQVLIDCSKFFTNYYCVPKNYSYYFSVDYLDIFQNFDQKIYEIFEYLELTLCQDRINNWLSVYNEYRSLNQNFLSLFLDQQVEVKVDNDKKMKIFKDIIQWRNDLYQNK